VTRETAKTLLDMKWMTKRIDCPAHSSLGFVSEPIEQYLARATPVAMSTDSMQRTKQKVGIKRILAIMASFEKKVVLFDSDCNLFVDFVSFDRHTLCDTLTYHVLTDNYNSRYFH
jgi:hypothetical protein